MTAKVTIVNTCNWRESIDVHDLTRDVVARLDRGGQMTVGLLPPDSGPVRFEISSNEPVEVGYLGEVEVTAHIPDPGREAYARYAEAVKGETHDGRPLPAWEDLGERIQNGWLAASGGVK